MGNRDVVTEASVPAIRCDQPPSSDARMDEVDNYGVASRYTPERGNSVAVARENHDARKRSCSTTA